jgi:hypothetical protein
MNVIWERKKLKTLLAVLAVFVAIVVAYYPGLHGPFVIYDQVHGLSGISISITSLSAQSLTHAFLMDDGSLSIQTIAKVGLAINFYFSKGASSAYGSKLTNLAMRLVNARLVHGLTLLLVRQQVWPPR